MITTDLAHSPADIARWALVQLGLGSDPTATPLQTWPIYSTSEPNSPDNVITVKNTLGHEFGRDQVMGQMQYHPGIQIRIRSQDELTGWRKAQAIRKMITEGAGVTGYFAVLVPVTYDAKGGPGSMYLVNNFNNVSQVIPAGKDRPTSNRSVFTINACIVIKQES